MAQRLPIDMFSDAPQENHLCLDCGIDISHRSRKALRCKSCVYNQTKDRNRKYYYGNRTRVLQRIKSRQQTPEYKQIRQEWEQRNPEKFKAYRQRRKQRHREKTGYDPEGRACEDCNADISDRGHNAIRCAPCSTPPAKKCPACDNNIRKRGPSRFCSEDCKQRYHQAKELEGYTKTCTKCNVTKEHTEFGFHYGRRRSACKSCEASATREYHQTLPAEERQSRRRLQGRRERDKKANLPPQEKAILRAKTRQAHRRKLYGPDFNENRLYAEQGGRCAICTRPKLLEELELDHDHETGELRGFLCKNCNFKLLPRYEKFPPQHQDSPRLNAYLSRGSQNGPS